MPCMCTPPRAPLKRMSVSNKWNSEIPFPYAVQMSFSASPGMLEGTHTTLTRYTLIYAVFFFPLPFQIVFYACLLCKRFFWDGLNWKLTLNFWGFHMGNYKEVATLQFVRFRNVTKSWIVTFLVRNFLRLNVIPQCGNLIYFWFLLMFIFLFG